MDVSLWSKAREQWWTYWVGFYHSRRLKVSSIMRHSYVRTSFSSLAYYDWQRLTGNQWKYIRYDLAPWMDLLCVWKNRSYRTIRDIRCMLVIK